MSAFQRYENALDIVMVHPDFIAVHRPTSAKASLHNNFAWLRMFVRSMWVATQKKSVGRRLLIQNDGSLNAA